MSSRREQTRRYTRDLCEVSLDEGGRGLFEVQGDPDGSPDLARIRREAAHRLAAAGLAAEVHAEALVRKVLITNRQPMDSPLGLSALIVWLCDRLAAPDATGSTTLHNAYQLGRLVTLVRAYAGESEQTSAAAALRDPARIETDGGKVTKAQLVAEAICAAGPDAPSGEVWSHLFGVLTRHAFKPIETGAKDERRIECEALDDGEPIAFDFSGFKAMVSREKKAMGMTPPRGRPRRK